jgi:uncharacterized protein (TIGR02594 family)
LCRFAAVRVPLFARICIDLYQQSRNKNMKLVARVAASLVLIAVAAPTAAVADPNDVLSYYNQPEVRNALRSGRAPQAKPNRISRAGNNSQRAGASARLFAGTGNPHWIAVARRYEGTNPTGRSSLWCADFLNLVLKRSGLQGTSSSAARSFAGYGQRLSGPKVGAIAVLARGKNGGHVGIVTGVDSNGNPILISGNHNKRVAEASYPQNRVIAYVWPTS